MKNDGLFWISAALNAILIILSLHAVIKFGIWFSLYHAICGVILLGLFLYAYYSGKRELLPVHAGANLLLIITLIGGARALFLTWWFSPVLHYLGGFMIALLIATLSFRRIPNDWRLYIWIVALTISVGVIWEWAELLLSFIEPNAVMFLVDTLTDLFMDTLGAMIAALLFMRSLR